MTLPTFREDAPVGAELVAHHDAGHDAHGECQREDLDPVEIEAAENVAPGFQPEAFADSQEGGEANREGWEDDVEGNNECKLQPRQDEGVKFHECLLAIY